VVVGTLHDARRRPLLGVAALAPGARANRREVGDAGPRRANAWRAVSPASSAASRSAPAAINGEPAKLRRLNKRFLAKAAESPVRALCRVFDVLGASAVTDRQIRDRIVIVVGNPTFGPTHRGYRASPAKKLVLELARRLPDVRRQRVHDQSALRQVRRASYKTPAPLIVDMKKCIHLNCGTGQ
jgi:hypothetical protein